MDFEKNEAEEIEKIARLEADQHTTSCAMRIVRGDGECECQRTGGAPAGGLPSALVDLPVKGEEPSPRSRRSRRRRSRAGRAGQLARRRPRRSAGAGELPNPFFLGLFAPGICAYYAGRVPAARGAGAALLGLLLQGLAVWSSQDAAIRSAYAALGLLILWSAGQFFREAGLGRIREVWRAAPGSLVVIHVLPGEELSDSAWVGLEWAAERRDVTIAILEGGVEIAVFGGGR